MGERMGGRVGERMGGWGSCTCTQKDDTAMSAYCRSVAPSAGMLSESTRALADLQTTRRGTCVSHNDEQRPHVSQAKYCAQHVSTAGASNAQRAPQDAATHSAASLSAKRCAKSSPILASVSGEVTSSILEGEGSTVFIMREVKTKSAPGVTSSV